MHVTRLRRRLRGALALVFIADVLSLTGLTWLAWQSRQAFDVWERQIDGGSFPPDNAGVWIVVTWMTILVAQGSYSARLFGDGPEEFRIVVQATLLTAGVVAWFCYITQYPLSRGFVVLTFAYGLPGLLIQRYAGRLVLHRIRRARRLTHRVIAVGPSRGILEVMAVLEREAYAGYRVVAAILTDESTEAVHLDVPVLASLDGLVEKCRSVEADTVLVARGGLETSAAMRRITWELEGTQLELVVVPSLTDVASPRIQMRPVAGLPLLHVEQPTARLAGGLPKRTFDLLGSALLLVLLSPLLAVIALAVKLGDRGPVLFRQARVGREGRPFQMVKFRSMVVDAEARLAELAEQNEGSGVLFKMKRDPRVTRIGGVLRKYSLDELPQLFNVFAGSMSLVGPRPPLPSEVERYGEDTHRRLAVRPGMTGLWQVSGRSELSWEESVRLDIYYVDNWSLMSDLVIIAKTVKAVIVGAGAY